MALVPLQLVARAEVQLDRVVAAARDQAAQDVTGAINRAALLLRDRLRDQVRRVFGRTRDRAARRTQNLANAVRAKLYPRDSGRGRHSLGAKGLVYMRVPWIELHITGGTINAAPEKWLAIPTAEAEKRGLARTIEERGAGGRFVAGSRAKVARIALARQRLQIGGLDTRFVRFKRRDLAAIVVDRADAEALGIKGLRRRVVRQDGAKVRRPFVVLFWMVKSVTLAPRFEIKSAEREAYTQLLNELNAQGYA